MASDWLDFRPAAAGALLGVFLLSVGGKTLPATILYAALILAVAIYDAARWRFGRKDG